MPIQGERLHLRIGAVAAGESELSFSVMTIDGVDHIVLFADQPKSRKSGIVLVMNETHLREVVALSEKTGATFAEIQRRRRAA